MGFSLWFPQFMWFVFFHFHLKVTCVSLSPNASSSKILCRPDQSHALLLFKQSFFVDSYASEGLPGHSPYPKTESWKEGTDCCLWDGVSCDVQTGYVIGLDLSSSMLYGSIHSHNPLFLLSRLRELDLSDNNFNRSSISSKFGFFLNMTHLNLNFSKFSGEVPSKISQLSCLVSLDLSVNYLTIETNTFNEIAQNLPNLKELDMSNMNMSLVEPIHLLNLSSSISHLLLADCKLRGDFPRNLLRRPNLQVLDLWGNDELNGFLPNSTWSSSLQTLRVSFTKISIYLHADFFDNLKLLKTLDLAGCNFVGSDVELFGNLVQLLHLELSFNNFSGQIPSSFANLKLLKSLGLANNNFGGPIPNFFENFTQLETLNLQSNQLEGPIPSLLGALSHLSNLDLSNNLLDATIPSSLFTLPRMHALLLNNNQLCGTININQSLSNSLILIDLSYNKLHGSIPSFHNNTLSYVDFSNNKLNGPVPDSIFNSVNLIELVLSSNDKLIGEVSSLVCKLQSLQILDLSNNSFSGFIPHCLGNLTNRLSVLHFGLNNFQGSIPITFSESCGLRYMNFEGNQLHGRIPPSIINCRDLEIIDLNNNRINDTFPYFFGILQHLQVLVMRSNNFYGSIKSFNGSSSFRKLRIFDLFNNSFDGPLPEQYFDHFEAMMNSNDQEMSYMGLEFYTYDNLYGSSYNYTVNLMTLKGSEIEMVKIQSFFTAIDLSHNKFTGNISESIGKLKLLKQLNLSHNGLTGNIPPSLRNLTSLESLDLSSNMLNGRIPTQLVDLTSLEVFNVAHNRLEGSIPQGKQFNTFASSSYEGNSALCGFPLEKCKNTEPQNPTTPSEELEKGFGWKSALAGYGCGIVFGVEMGYLVFRIRKPAWFVRMVEDNQRQRRFRMNRRRRN